MFLKEIQNGKLLLDDLLSLCQFHTPSRISFKQFSLWRDFLMLILIFYFLFFLLILISWHSWLIFLGIPPTPTSSAASKKNSSRRNAWGNLSYADLITKAITSAADNRLTLSQIYEWMVQNVPYFKDKGDSNSSAGWKVSICYTFSLQLQYNCKIQCMEKPSWKCSSNDLQFINSLLIKKNYWDVDASSTWFIGLFYNYFLWSSNTFDHHFLYDHAKVLYFSARHNQFIYFSKFKK